MSSTVRIKNSLRKAAMRAEGIKPEAIEAMSLNALALIETLETELTVVWSALSKMERGMSNTYDHVAAIFKKLTPPEEPKKRRPRRTQRSRRRKSADPDLNYRQSR